eukprot:CAMPEP_0181124696 /NCGR_PEP_ID=MMETSP1071-20121207/26626_1 /TAXON_ID=35127 /ORGANISM="Thalassiosira sp., Strain NH16" /LENGTH=303 /DNA_ID=CAMNT_0023210033 /DNA_START=258 /DNA_END=1169 /DNA_ORIENTATION=+
MASSSSSLSLPPPEGGEEAAGETHSYNPGGCPPSSYESIADTMDSPLDERHETSSNNPTACDGRRPSSGSDETPYQIFRKSTKMDAKEDDGGDDNDRKKGGIAGVAAAADEDDADDDEEEEVYDSFLSFAFGKNDKENGGAARSATTTPRGGGGGANPFLSPNSVEIRQNAKRGAAATRNKKMNDKNSRRRSLPLQPLSSLMNISSGASSTSFSKDDGHKGKGGSISKGAFSLFSDTNHQKNANNNSSSSNFGDRDIKKELEADLEEIREAAGRVAGMASRAGNEALEAFSSGARNVIGQLFD